MKYRIWFKSGGYTETTLSLAQIGNDIKTIESLT